MVLEEEVEDLALVNLPVAGGEEFGCLQYTSLLEPRFEQGREGLGIEEVAVENGGSFAEPFIIFVGKEVMDGFAASP